MIIIVYTLWLSEKIGLDVTLPTEKQWEMACLGEKEGVFYFEGDDFSKY
jgi:formylglycine-generating enzyme required for sulfatase activity